MERFIVIKTQSGQFLINPNKVRNIEYWGSDMIWINYTDDKTDKFYFNTAENAQYAFDHIQNQIT